VPGHRHPRDSHRRRRVILVKREITMTKPKIVHRPSRAKQRAPLKHRVDAACDGACGAATTRLIAGDVRTESALWAETHTRIDPPSTKNSLEGVDSLSGGDSIRRSRN